MFTLIGGGEFVTLASLGYLFGWSAIALFVGYSLGFVFLGVLAHRIRENSASRDYLSLPDYAFDKFGPFVGLLVLTISFAAFFALLMLQFSAIGSIVPDLTGISRGTAIIVSGLVVIGYLFVAGFRAVVRTDVLQACSMIILVPMILYFLVTETGVHIDFAAGSEGTLPLDLWASLVATGALIAAASADVWQRAFAARTNLSATVGFFGELSHLSQLDWQVLGLEHWRMG